MKYNNIYTILLSLILISLKSQTLSYDSISSPNNDPYSFLEDIDNEKVMEYLKKQDQLTDSILKTIQSTNSIYDEFIGKRKNKTEISKLEIVNNTLFYLKKDGDLHAYPKLYKRSIFKGKEKLLYDPSTISTNSSDLYINYINPSPDGTKIIIGLSEGGKEFSNLIILNTNNLYQYPTTLDKTFPNSFFTSWLYDNSQFIYAKFPNSNNTGVDRYENFESRIIKLDHEKIKSNEVIFSEKHNPNINIKKSDFPLTYTINSSTNYLFSGIFDGSNSVDHYYKTIHDKKWSKLYDANESIISFSINKNQLIYLTNKNTPNYSIRQTSLSKPDYTNYQTLIAEDSISVLEDFVLTKNGIYFSKVKNGVEAKLYHYQKGKINEVKLPKKAGSIKLNSNYDQCWIKIEGWTFEEEYYMINPKNDKLKPIIFSDDNHIQIENAIIKEIEIPSHDGTLVPLSIIYKKGLKLNGKNKVLLNAYGAYGYNYDALYENYLDYWLSEGGVYAIAHVRGGGEKGKKWHEGGFKKTKPNSWKDLIACTEYLINQGYTSPSYLAIRGTSAGGIVIGRAITERPDLFKVAVVNVGALNIIEMEKMATGAANTPEFGSVKNPEELKYLYEMDAYHHIQKDVKYPSVYLTAGMNDPRIPVFQPAKFAAKMQEYSTSGNPILLDINFNSGHGYDVSDEIFYDELKKTMNFILSQMGHPYYKNTSNSNK